MRAGSQWKYLYGAVDRVRQTVDFLLTARRNETAARRFCQRAMDLHDVPRAITIDRSGANTATVLGLGTHRREGHQAASATEAGLQDLRHHGA